MRRGEICALEVSDINEFNIRVSQFVIDIALRNTTNGKIVPLVPDSITKRFIDTIKLLNIPRFRFHDLCHYGASILHAIGIPDQYIIQRGGWSTDNVMKSIYRGAITEETKKSII